jgi:hypothetical protein
MSRTILVSALAFAAPIRSSFRTVSADAGLPHRDQ